jgi:hypothetical protein
LEGLLLFGVAAQDFGAAKDDHAAEVGGEGGRS